MTTHSTPREILAQLGGSQFLAMTGAKNLVGSENWLSFKLPANFAANGINYLKIELDANDTYNLEFGRVWGINYSVKKRETGIYNDMLRERFTVVTGLDCTMGTIRRAVAS